MPKLPWMLVSSSHLLVIVATMSRQSAMAHPITMKARQGIKGELSVGILAWTWSWPKVIGFPCSWGYPRILNRDLRTV
ncbi:MAG: hypothetical protein M1596_00085 [Firmicutes bacterium]|nr:hypothetical protein [Bacillota bacterium]